MNEKFKRTEMLFGQAAMEKLKTAKIILFGVGGVGSYAAEAIIRSGVGALVLVDHDKIEISNINRQLHATTETIGEYKAEVMSRRLRSINPEANIEARKIFVTPDNVPSLGLENFDYLVDAVDNVTAKLSIIEWADKYKKPIISAMGTGNKIYPELLRIDDISKTEVCPLARVMRRELKQRGITRIQVCFSPEKPVLEGSRIPGSTSFVPAAAGLLMAAEVIRQLTK